MSFDGSLAVVTGAASGMGLETAQALAHAGAIVYGIDLRQEGLDREFSHLPGAKGFALDVSDSAALNAVFAEVEAEQGDLRVLVNAAGVSTPNKEKQA